MRLNERMLEWAFALEAIAQAGPRTVLDVGTGRTAWPALLAGSGLKVTASDEKRAYYGGKPFANRHCDVVDDDICHTHLTGPYDAITCISTLEHIPDHQAAVKAMMGLLAPDGILIITVPFHETRHVENVYALPEAGYGQNAPYVCQVFNRADVEAWGTIVEERHWRVFTGELWTFGERIYPYETVETGGQLAGFVVRA